MASSSQVFLFALTSSILFLLSPSLTLAQSPSAPAPSPPGPLNFTGILDKNGQYTTFIRLLTVSTQVANQIVNQLNTSTEGLTVFAPTDNAFNNLKAGLINNLSPEQQVQLILYHVVPKFYALQSLLTVSNPVRTQANFGLNFTGQSNQVNVSTGMVETQINNALISQFPLAMYQVDKVLLPSELFTASPPSSSPPAPATKSSGSNTTATANGPSSSENTNIASPRNVWLSFVVGAMAICMGLLS